MAKYAEIKYGQPYIVHADTNSPQSNNSNAQSRLTDPSVANVYYSKYADIYIELKDEFGNLTEGNYATINYQEYISGQPGQIRQITLIGSVTPVQYGALIEQNTAESYFSYSVRLAGVVVESDGTYTPPNICDATIESVFINKKESAPGSKDGQITIVASSNAGSLQYSLDNINWQPEFVFKNLSGGSYTAYIKDAIDCRDTQPFTLETIASLLTNDPVIDLGGGNKSRWSAAFNPVVFTYQRRDFPITDIYAGLQKQQTVFVVNGTLLNSAASLSASDWIAQACLESNYGKSKLANLHHNYFGIKASSAWKGKTVTYQTTEYVNSKPVVAKQVFRSYPTLVAGFADRVHFLQVNKRYKLHGVFNSATPEEQAHCFLKAGYATDPAYPQKLISIITKYNLKQYDPPCKTPSNTSTIISTTNLK